MNTITETNRIDFSKFTEIISGTILKNTEAVFYTGTYNDVSSHMISISDNTPIVMSDSFVKKEVKAVSLPKVFNVSMGALIISAMLTGVFATLFALEPVPSIDRFSSFIGLICGLASCYVFWYEGVIKGDDL